MFPSLRAVTAFVFLVGGAWAAPAQSAPDAQEAVRASVKRHTGAVCRSFDGRRQTDKARRCLAQLATSPGEPSRAIDRPVSFDVRGTAHVAAVDTVVLGVGF